MLHEIYGWLDTGSVILIYGIAIVVALIKTNDLPHILERIANLEGRNCRKTRRRRK